MKLKIAAFYSSTCCGGTCETDDYAIFTEDFVDRGEHWCQITPWVEVNLDKIPDKREYPFYELNLRGNHANQS